MTVVAYTRGVMAADSSCFIGDTAVHPAKKIWQVGGGLVGCAGDLYAMVAFVRWLLDGAIDEDYPNLSFEAIVVDPSGRVRAYDGGNPEPFDVKVPYCAIGSGRDFALGAMHAGADARGAVKAATVHHAQVKPPVRAYRLKRLP